MADTQENGLSDEELVKALRKAAKKVAKKQIAKALAKLFADKESPLAKAIAAAVADRPTKKEVTAQDEAVFNGMIKVLKDGPPEDEDGKDELKKTATADSPIRL